MKFIHDKVKIAESVQAGYYDEKGLTYSESRRYKYPSKYMFIKFLEPMLKNELKGIRGTVDVWSMRDHTEGSETIHVELKFFAKSKPKSKGVKK